MIHHDPTRKAEEFWLVFYGLSDNVSYDAHQLAAGSKTTDHFCLPETFSLVNKAEKTRRQIVVRGRVRIAANYFSTEGETKREAVNNFIRSGAYDGVIDFDAAAHDPAHPTRLLPAYDSGDHLHPNDAGYQAMANAIDLALFRNK